MNKQKITTGLWGLLIIILGVGALAYNFGALDQYKLITAYIVAALLAVMGAAFLLAIAFQRENWFYVIPGFSLLSLGGMVYLTTLENVKPEWLGALFLGGIALGFLVIFLKNRQERWWALLQAETILMHLLRGSGLTGLAGMAWGPSDGIIRPLLGMRREQIQEALRRWGIAWREDAGCRKGGGEVGLEVVRIDPVPHADQARDRKKRRLQQGR